ncbi:hypothetical protein BaRGS_00012490 [Batillaria attramentaria]|uniref:EF-hand domain-containing protein n=1 Tax=Batillaria attramentaria TaxID=370345 RepID=A0ABD0LAC0_9CAEN|nr:hypothetical protein BaRGS_025758 [Batillaria attramentaria]
MAHLSEEERQYCCQVFLDMDQDGSGWLNERELTEGFRRLGYKVTDEQARSTFRAIDKNGDGHVTFDEFLACVKHVERSNPKAKKEAKLRRAFQQMDMDGDGMLSEKELMDGLKHAGYHLTREQAKKLVSDLDKDGNGKISFEEFICMFQI